MAMAMAMAMAMVMAMAMAMAMAGISLYSPPLVYVQTQHRVQT